MDEWTWKYRRKIQYNILRPTEAHDYRAYELHLYKTKISKEWHTTDSKFV